MSIEDVRKKVDQERRFAQEQEDRKRKEYFSLPTVKEWEGSIVELTNRIYSELFQGVMRKLSFTREPREIINSRFEYIWRVVEKNFIAIYSVVDVGLIRWNENSKINPLSWRGELNTPSQLHYGLGRSHSSPFELESAFDDIFEYFYRKKLEQEKI